MKKSWAMFFVLALFAFSFASAQTEVSFFYGNGCPHCANVEASGVLEKVAGLENVTLTKYEIYYNETSRNLFYDFGDKLGIKSTGMGVPLAVINKSGKLSYLAGDKPIINQLESSIQTGEDAGNTNENVSPTNPDAHKITLGGIILAALIDSINPCAFGVLIFLMISLLKMGSSKRALKAGMIYTLVVFITYFLSGLGIFKAIQSFTSITRIIYLSAGVLVLIVGLLELVDFVRKDKESIVKISKRVKPLMEKFTHRGTIPAIVVLGIIVSLFELPCTGGIYLAILATMSINKTFAIGYLILYNFIFVLPLIVITLLIYKGASPEKLQKWTNTEKKWMKLSAGLLMVVLGIYILYSAL